MDTFTLLAKILFRCVGRHILFNRKKNEEDVIKEIENLMLQLHVFQEMTMFCSSPWDLEL